MLDLLDVGELVGFEEFCQPASVTAARVGLPTEQHGVVRQSGQDFGQLSRFQELVELLEVVGAIVAGELALLPLAKVALGQAKFGLMRALPPPRRAP